MVQFTTTIYKYNEKGEKTGWTYIVVPADIANQLMPGNKKVFYVKGRLDNFPIKRVSILPLGKGEFILPINATMRKGIGKRHGAMLTVKLEVDSSPFVFDNDFMECLDDDKEAKAFFKTLPGAHQRYYSKWISGAKTEATKAKRIAQAINGLSRKQNYAEMMRALKANK